MVVVEVLQGDSAAAVADDLFGSGADLQAFFDHAALDVKASGGGEEGEEELEWLSNKEAFPAVETMASSAPRQRTKGVPPPRWEVGWSPRQAPAVARPPAAGWRCRHCGTDKTPQRREGPEGRSTLCNACGVRYRSGRLVPEYRPASSPTFSPELHSNRHSRVVEMRRRREAAAGASLAAAGKGEEKGNEKLECLSNKGEFLAVQMMAAARPRTEGTRRPRKAVDWPAIAWRPPPPPRAPAVAARRPSQGGGVGVAVDQGRAPGGGDDGVGGCAAAYQGRTAVPADGGLNPAAPLAPAAAPGQQFGTEKTLQRLGGAEGRSTLCNACVVQYRSGCMVPVLPPACSPAFSPELRFDWHNRVEMHRRRERSAKLPPATARAGEKGKEELEWPSNKGVFPAAQAMSPAAAGARPQTKGVRRQRQRQQLRRRRVVELSPPRTPPPLRRRSRCGGEAAAVEQGRVRDGGAAADEVLAAAPAGGGKDPAAPAAAPRTPAVSRRRCRHCGTEKTPQWREGPEGRQTLCNACGVQYKSGRLVPEYRPASSPTFSPGLHSNCHRQVVQLRRRREESAEVSPAAAAVGDK
ncbi:hypothetical protein SETIT_9G232500v2 [Setaria italica]|uniref:GATA-type domain-containing protein n=1 Tax=Setaria italica TaxID=4555 RepID=K4A7L5_SETIT|nr:uncharacterized protein LOC101761214 [Setaria italica]RCV42649.1 hypothetical protein SETIT_9G232500v2 [Setaria italica]